jgi:tetratricopeptide (TPR) repeat protein
VAAAAEASSIEALRVADAIQNAGIPADSVLAIASKTIQAKYLMSQKQFGAAADLFRESIALQTSLPYTEPPFWYYAIEQSLGAALYQAGDYADAAAAFEASLVRHPNSAWSLYALMKTYEKQGRKDEAIAMAELYRKASKTGGDLPFIQL